MGNEKVVGVAAALIYLLLEALQLQLGLLKLPKGNINRRKGGMEIPICHKFRSRAFSDLPHNTLKAIGIVHQAVTPGKHGVGVAVRGDAVGGLQLSEQLGDLVGLVEGHVERHEVVVGKRGREKVEVTHLGEEG